MRDLHFEGFLVRKAFFGGKAGDWAVFGNIALKWKKKTTIGRALIGKSCRGVLIS